MLRTLTSGNPRPGLPLVMAAALCACGLGACSSGVEPRFAVEDVSVTERTAEGLVLAFVIAGDNEGGDAFPLAEVDYRVTLDGREVFQGVRSAQTTLERFGQDRFVLPAVVPTPALERLGDSPRYEITGTVTYFPPGVIAQTLYDRGWVKPTAPLAASGTVALGAAATTAPPDAAEQGE